MLMFGREKSFLLNVAIVEVVGKLSVQRQRCVRRQKGVPVRSGKNERLGVIVRSESGYWYYSMVDVE